MDSNRFNSQNGVLVSFESALQHILGWPGEGAVHDDDNDKGSVTGRFGKALVSIEATLNPCSRKVLTWSIRIITCMYVIKAHTAFSLMGRLLFGEALSTTASYIHIQRKPFIGFCTKPSAGRRVRILAMGHWSVQSWSLHDFHFHA